MQMPYWELKVRIKQLERYNKEIADTMKESTKSMPQMPHPHRK